MAENKQPVFSIILPTYNRAHLLSRAIKSVLSQTFQDFELIVIDDASPDQTQELVASFHDSRLVYLQQKKNRGPSTVRNVGIRQARGKYVSFLDDDDEYMPQFLVETYRVFEAAPEQVGFTWCGVRDVQDTPGGERTIRERLWESYPESGTHIYSTSYGLTIRANCFDIVGLFDEEIVGGVEDTDLLLRLGRSFDFRVVSGILIKRHHHQEAQLTDITPQRAKGYEQLLAKHAEFFKKGSFQWRRYYQRAAFLYYQTGNEVRARQLMLKVIQANPLRLRTWKTLICFEIFGTETLGLRQKISFYKAYLNMFARKG
jgi:glycosyltransferase involved in cell wall biosynthesis